MEWTYTQIWSHFSLTPQCKNFPWKYEENQGTSQRFSVARLKLALFVLSSSVKFFFVFHFKGGQSELRALPNPNRFQVVREDCCYTLCPEVH